MMGRPLLVTANEAWNLVNFRASLIEAMIARGFVVIAAAPYEADSVARLEALGCTFVHVPIDQAGVHPLRDLKTIVAYRQLLRRYRPAALVSWTIKPNLYGGIAAALERTSAFPNVSGLGTAFLHYGLVNRIARLLYRVGFARARTVFFQNANDQSIFLADRLVRPDQAKVLPGSGVDLDHFAPANDTRPNPGQFLMLARLIADKGVREYVAAARRLRPEHPDAKFVLMGAANIANRTAITADELSAWQAEGVIEYRRPEDDVRPAIAASDVVVLPSYREGMARVLLEAAAMARPIIASDVPGCAEIVSDGGNGFLCEARSVNSLAEAMQRALALDDMQWRRMGAAGRERIEREFSQDVVLAEYFAAFDAAGIAP